MRPRKTNRELPPCVYLRHGAYYYVKAGKWTRIGTTLPEMYRELARLSAHAEGSVAALVNAIVKEAESRVRPGTLRQYQLLGAKVAKIFAEFKPDRLKARDVAQFIDHYKRTPSQANTMRTLLKQAMDKAVLQGLCEANPVTVVPPLRQPKRDRYLTDEEFNKVRAAGNAVLAVVMDIAYFTGQRIGDVIAIKLSDISDAGVTFRQQKTGKRLCVVMSPELRAAIDRARALHGSIPKVFLFARRNGKPRTYAAVKKLMAQAAKRAGVEDVHFHDIRAKSLTDARAQGKNPQRLGGHATEAMTNRYLRGKETDIAEGPSFGQKPEVLDKRPK